MKVTKIVKTLFMEKEEVPQGTELVELKCQQVLLSTEVGTSEFRAAYEQLEKVKALKMAEAKAKKMPKIDPAIVGAGIGVVGQIVCTGMIERYNAEGHLFPTKNITTSWLGLNGLWTRVIGAFKR